MERRKLVFGVTGTVIGSVILGANCSPAPQKSKKPNVIYILADDLGYGDLACYGQQKIETPNIDALASKGIRFTQHYSGTAVSAPSRCVLLTGLHTGHSQINNNDEMASRGNVWSHSAMLADSTLEGQRPLKEGTITLATKMKEAGLVTACVGKWGLGYPGSEGTPNKMGFDFFYGYNCQRQAHTYFPPFVYRNERREYLNNEFRPPHASPLDKGADPYLERSYEKYWQKEYVPDLSFNEIRSFINNNRDTSFFLMWTTTIPHVPLQAPKRWVDYYVKKFGDEKPYTGGEYFPCRYPHATYAAMISYFDEQVGLLVEQLKELGIYDNTVIIFTSDNGPSMATGGADSPWFNSAAPFSSENGRVKASLREGGIRVPMVITWGEKIKRARESDHISAFWDVMPTLCELEGVKAPAETDGISFLPTLLGKKQKKHEYLYWEFPAGSGSKALRMGDWKDYIENTNKGNTLIELYDLKKDPLEKNDVAALNKDVVKKMNEIMNK